MTDHDLMREAPAASPCPPPVPSPQGIETPWTAPQVAQVLAALPKQARMLITIDGPCGSGKTTLAAALAQALGVPCVHTDDFYIPHAQKTAERLAIPGGNEDVDRLMAEVLTPWQAGKPIVYRPYNPFLDCQTEPISLDAPQVLILEGSYSNLPPIRALASVRIWLTVSPEVQRNRILIRNGAERLQMFLSKWIPLEQAYHEAYHLPDDGNLVISGEEETGGEKPW